MGQFVRQQFPGCQRILAIFPGRKHDMNAHRVGARGDDGGGCRRLGIVVDTHRVEAVTEMCVHAPARVGAKGAAGRVQHLIDLGRKSEPNRLADRRTLQTAFPTGFAFAIQTGPVAAGAFAL